MPMKVSASIPARLDASGLIGRTMRGRESLRTVIANRWRGFENGILRRKAPHAVLSWRYFLPGQGRNVELHRKAFLHAWSRNPIFIRILIAIYSYGLWYLYHAWRQVLSVWWNREPGLEKRIGLSGLRQLSGLAVLAYGHATPPSYYYRYGLHGLPESRWLDFVFTHELPHWHRAMSPELGESSSRLMAHKHAFAREMESMGLPAVETRLLLRRGEPIPERLFCGQSLFLKPESGSRKQGCFELRHDPSDGSYALVGRESVFGEENILAALKPLFGGQDYIAQPLLENHSGLSRHYDIDRLATIRLVTLRGPHQGKSIRACLEIPIEGKADRIFPMAIDVGTGILYRFERDSGQVPEALRGVIDALEGFRVPLWRDVVATAEAAHGAFRDLFSIGWDLAVTDQGVKVLEGNINWAVMVHQISGRPLLGDLDSAPLSLRMDSSAALDHSLKEAHDTLARFNADPAQLTALSAISAALSTCFQSGHKVLACGNGGSACDANHFAEEFTGRFRKHRRALPVIALTEAAHMTCVANDYGFEEVFARGVEAFGKPGDLLLAISTSGNSPNIVRAVEAAKALGMDTILLLGKSGGKLKGSGTHEIIVASETTERVQEIHMLALHVLIESVERTLFPENYL